MQATWPARNAPNALLMQAIDAPLPDDPPLPFKDSAPSTDGPTQAAPSGTTLDLLIASCVTHSAS